MAPFDLNNYVVKSGSGVTRNIFHLLGYMDSAYHGGTQHLLLPHHKLLEEVDRDVVVRGEEHADIAGKEVIDLAFASILRLELFR